MAFRVARTWALGCLLCACSDAAQTAEPSPPRDAAVADAAARDSGAMAEDAGEEAPPDAAGLSADAAAAGSAHDAAAADAAASKGHDAAVATAPCAPPVDPDAPATELSQTGCMSKDSPTQFAAFVLPYEVNSPLWSDGADKLRGVRLPDGGKIHVKDCAKNPAECTQGAADSGKWVFPVGTVLLKSFLFDGKLVETRLFVHVTADSWAGYGYQWNEAQTRATLVPDDRVHVTFQTGQRSVEWNYPNRIDCLKCHNVEGGSSLGLETAQLNRDVNGKNLIDRFAEQGFFEEPPAKPYAAALVTPYKDQAGAPPKSANLETRARSYMHANCGFCHRPDGAFPDLDLRYDVAWADTHLCNTAPLKGDVGVPTATNVTPGKPKESIVWLRMAAQPGQGRMPQIGTAKVDDAGLSLIGDWITSLRGCP